MLLVRDFYPVPRFMLAKLIPLLARSAFRRLPSSAFELDEVLKPTLETEIEFPKYIENNVQMYKLTTWSPDSRNIPKICT